MKHRATSRGKTVVRTKCTGKHSHDQFEVILDDLKTIMDVLRSLPEQYLDDRFLLLIIDYWLLVPGSISETRSLLNL